MTIIHRTGSDFGVIGIQPPTLPPDKLPKYEVCPVCLGTRDDFDPKTNKLVDCKECTGCGYITDSDGDLLTKEEAKGE